MENEIAEGFLAVVDEIVKAHNGLGLSDLYPSLKFIPVVTGFLPKLKSLHGAADSILGGILEQHRAKREEKIR
ncbi:unnamed protein product [Linum tenue]|uniref:Uncharacterized protein n=1 Tax=Linum tenue TaxID=586396 RepID=A0AAV0NAS5_9ROSI|nr:unnamed protein product [Linum tenue]